MITLKRSFLLVIVAMETLSCSNQVDQTKNTSTLPVTKIHNQVPSPTAPPTNPPGVASQKTKSVDEEHPSGVLVGGWQSARWGMNNYEIVASLPDAKPLIRPEVYDVGGKKRVATIGIERYEISGEYFDVNFLMDESEKLEKVILKPKGNTGKAVVFQSLEKLLTEKYGKPNLVQDHGANDLGSTGNTCIWNMPGLTITLNYLKTSLFEHMNLIYSNPDTSNLKKI